MVKWFKFLKDQGQNKIGARVQLDDASTETKQWVTDKTVEETVSPERAALNDALGEFQKEIQKSVSEAFAGVTKDLKTEVDGGRLRITVGKDLSLDDPNEGWGPKEVSMGAFAKAVHESHNATLPHEKMSKYLDIRAKKIVDASGGSLSVAQVKAPSGGSTLYGEDGGVLVPSMQSTDAMDKAFESSDILSLCDRGTTLGNTKEILVLKQDGLDITSRFGGILPYWRVEGGQMQASKLQWERERIGLEEIYAYVPMTNELLADSALSLTTWLNTRVPQAIMFKVNSALIAGDGIGKPLGFLNEKCLVTTSKDSGQAADTITFTNIDNMLMSIPSYLWPFVRILYNPFLVPTMQNATRAISASTYPYGNKPLFVRKGEAGNATDMIGGFPAIPTEFCKKPGDLGDIIAAVPNQYLVVTKGTIESAVSIHVRFDYNETVFRFVFRVGGQCWWKKALTPLNGPSGVTVSPLVQLEAR